MITSPIIYIVENERTGATGFSVEEPHVKVFSKGRLLHANGMWETIDEVGHNELDEVEDLSESDLAHLKKAVAAGQERLRYRADAAKRDAKKRDDLLVEQVTGWWESQDMSMCEIGNMTFARNYKIGRSIACRKKSGRNTWYIGLESLDEAISLARGDKKIVYRSRTNNFRIVDA
jgi:hypothetical protein